MQITLPRSVCLRQRAETEQTAKDRETQRAKFECIIMMIIILLDNYAVDKHIWLEDTDFEQHKITQKKKSEKFALDFLHSSYANRHIRVCLSVGSLRTANKANRQLLFRCLFRSLRL